jgi:hypothetical protein
VFRRSALPLRSNSEVCSPAECLGGGVQARVLGGGDEQAQVGEFHFQRPSCFLAGNDQRIIVDLQDGLEAAPSRTAFELRP